MAELSLRSVSKTFGTVAALLDIDLEIAHREFVVIVGPSGCGKSTLLRVIAGLEQVTSGEIHVGGAAVHRTPAAKRGLAMVFQNYALYPHKTVAQNMGFALKMAKVPRDEIDRRVDEAARILQIEDLLERKPRQLSGGQRQRVAIGRAIVREPKVFLFDEPLSNLDAALRVDMRVELAKLHNSIDATMIYVTHDQTEAMTMAGDSITVDVPGGLRLAVPAQPAGTAVGDSVTLGVRPEHLAVGPDAAGATVALDVYVTEPLGGETILYGHIGDTQTLVVKVPGGVPARKGQRIPVHVAAAACHLFDESGVALPRLAGADDMAEEAIEAVGGRL